jgi:hypothetical protein
MSRLKIGVEFFLMTRAAAEVSSVAAIFFLPGIQRRGRRALRKEISSKTPPPSGDGEANGDDETRGANERSGVRGIDPPTGLGYGNSGVGNIGNFAEEAGL